MDEWVGWTEKLHDSGRPEGIQHVGRGGAIPRGSTMVRMTGYIGMGSNLGDRWSNLRAGVSGLRGAGPTVLAVSSVWATEPVDSPGPLWFLNMAVKVSTGLPPLELLDRLLAIEREAGRTRSEPNGPRTLDLDLLVLGELEWGDDRLQLPHPRMWQRRFVLGPLAEIAPDLLNPRTGRTVACEQDRLRDPAAVVVVGRLGDC